MDPLCRQLLLSFAQTVQESILVLYIVNIKKLVIVLDIFSFVLLASNSSNVVVSYVYSVCIIFTIVRECCKDDDQSQ